MCSAVPLLSCSPTTGSYFISVASSHMQDEWPSISTQHPENLSPSILGGQATTTLSFPPATTLPLLALSTCY